MKMGFEFYVGIVGLGLMGMGVVLLYVCVGFFIWGVDLNSNVCVMLKEVGVCGVFDNVVMFVEKLDVLLVLVVNVVQVKQVLFGEIGVV